MGNRNRGEGWCLAIWFDFSALNWDRGLVNCGTNILCGCWLFCWNEIQVFLLEGLHNHWGKQNQGGEVMSCHFIWVLSIKLGSWSCQLWYQHLLCMLTLLSKPDSGFLLQGFHNHCWTQNQRWEVTSHHFIWLLSIKLGLWSCQLRYQHPSLVLTLLMKWHSGL